jgi:hypothetical protein
MYFEFFPPNRAILHIVPPPSHPPPFCSLPIGGVQGRRRGAGGLRMLKVKLMAASGVSRRCSRYHFISTTTSLTPGFSSSSDSYSTRIPLRKKNDMCGVHAYDNCQAECLGFRMQMDIRGMRGGVLVECGSQALAMR